MAKKYDKERLLADWRTGAFSQRDLAYRYKLSNGTIAKLTKGVAKDLELIVSAKSQAEHELSLKNEQEVSAVNEQVEERTKNLKFIHDATLKNASEMMKKVGDETTHKEHKFIQETITKAGEALGVIDKAGAQVLVQQNNTTGAALSGQALADELKRRDLPLLDLD